MLSSKYRLSKLILAPIVALFLALPALIPANAGAQTVDRGEVEQIIRDYLLQNPELMLEVQDALKAKQEAEEKRRIAAEGE